MSNFAKEQLQKHGWTEGKGLGKNEDGIAQAIKPTLKFNNAGIGYKETVTEHWWQAQFDNAAKNIKIEAHEDQVSLSLIDSNQNTILSKKSEGNKQYVNFLKTADLYNGFLTQEFSKSSVKSEKKETATDLVNIPLTDEQLYAACDGRTAYKTARHSLTLNGKLERIAQQDKLLLDGSISSTSQCSTHKIDYNKSTDLDYSSFKNNLIKGFSQRFVVLAKNEKEYIEKLNELSQKLSTWDLKEDDAESQHKSLKNKRKRNLDCVIKIDPPEIKDTYFFRKKQKCSLDSSLKEVIESEVGEKKSFYEEIETGIKKMSIKVKAKKQEIEQEPSSTYYETKQKNIGQLEKQSKSHHVSHIKYSKLADEWNRMRKMKRKESLDYLLIKRIFEERSVKNHKNLSSNIEKCIIQYPWMKMKLHFVKNLKKDLKNEKKSDVIDKQKEVKCKKMRTQTHLTPV